ncbi:MAG: VOC family protein [Marinovum algicola]|jgi:2,3-dihydroxy-p-cumate/2,3-dihydroxybenzoate 3,4-dioxygenase|uniref:VOC family protein n=1 Tax=Marinovum algicola TaxID=42444 RepID=UPI0032ED422E
MIELKDVSYARLGTRDMDDAVAFATGYLGLEVAERTAQATYLRSDDRGHTLCYFEGDPADQTVAFEVENEECLRLAADTLDRLGHPVYQGNSVECDLRKVRSFLRFKDPTGNSIELVVRPERSGQRYFATRDAGITGFSHIGLYTTDPVRDEQFWTQVCNAKVSDRIGDIPLMRVNEIHHTIALLVSDKAGIQHINHQVQTNDDILRSYNFLVDRNVDIVFGPGRHPTSGARFLYFKGPDDMVFEYSVGVDAIEDEEGHQPRQFGFEPTSLCKWGSTPAPTFRR